MSFWEEFGQRLTQESQKALQKTRDLASVVTMNADISDSRRKINDLYQELGQLLVKEAFAGMTAEELRNALAEELEDENTESTAREIRITNWQDFYSKVMFIRSEEEVIALNEAKIDELKAETRCPNCGKAVSKGMSFCPDCGTKLAVEEPAAAEAEAAAEPAAEASETVAPEAAAAPEAEAAASEATAEETPSEE